jgi:hypothetical protein
MIFVGTRLISITGTTHTIILWSKDSNLFLGDFPFIQYGTTIGGWNFNYYKGIIATPTITLLAGSKADIRIYDKAISDDAIFDLYADTVNFEGKRHLPGFRITEDL